MSQVYSIAVIVGSLRADSINRKIALALAQLAPASLQLNIVEIGDLPLYNEDIDTPDAAPAAYARFRQQIAAADGVLFVTPEYNRSVPGAEERHRCRLASLWPERLEWQAGRGDQRFTRRHWRLRRQPSSAPVAGVS